MKKPKFISMFSTAGTLILAMIILSVGLACFILEKTIIIPIKNISSRKKGYSICGQCLGSGRDSMNFEPIYCTKCKGTGKIFWIDKILEGD